MIASLSLSPQKSAIEQADGETTSWQSAFQRLLPAIRDQAGFAFRHLPAEVRAESIQETLCCACLAYARLFRRGRADMVTSSTLAHFAILRCRGGRECGQRRNGEDVLSVYARRRKVIGVESLQANDAQDSGWREVLVEDRSTTPADLAAIRIDYREFLASLDPRRRRIAEVLSSGESTLRTAQLFGVSPTRICQFRHEFRVAWNLFIGNEGLEAA